MTKVVASPVSPTLPVYTASLALIRERQRLIKELLGPNRNVSYRKFYAYVIQAVDSIENMIRLNEDRQGEFGDVLENELSLWAIVNDFAKRRDISLRQLDVPEGMSLSVDVRRRIEKQIELETQRITATLKDIRTLLAKESGSLIEYVPVKSVA